jgi:hypothetical protein
MVLARRKASVPGSSASWRSRRLGLLLVFVTLLFAVVPGAGSAATDLTKLSFAPPVYVSQNPAHQAAEPSIRVDETDPKQRIWITAPAGILPGSRFQAAEEPDSGDFLWYSDDDGKTWTRVPGLAPGSNPTLVGGGDSDVVTTTGQPDRVFMTGLTLANVTLAASCDGGETFSSNPFTNLGTVEDRQWIDGYEDRAKPALGPDFLLTYGGVAERRIWVHQVATTCVDGKATPPSAALPRIDVSGPECVEGLFDPQCYQWPGNLAVDERTGDVYVTHNTFGEQAEQPTPFPDPFDDVIVARIDDGAERVVSQPDVHKFVAANNRPDTFDSFTVVAVDRASNVYVVWSERHPERQTTDTMLAVSKNRGETWSKPIKVNRGPQTTTFPWIVAGDAGKIDIVYYGTSAKGPSPEEVPETSKWKVWMAQSLNALDPTPNFRENPATGFMHQGSICTSGTGCAAGTRDLLDFFQVDVDAQGMANIAYTDNLNTPPDGPDKHQEWVTFVQQKGGKGLYGR